MCPSQTLPLPTFLQRFALHLAWLLPAALGFGIGEGLVTASAVSDASGTFVHQLSALLIATTLIGALALPLAAGAALLLAWDPTHHLGAHLKSGLGGGLDDAQEEPGHPSAAVIATLFLIAVALLAGALSGKRFIPSMSPRFAAVATAMATLLAIVIMLPVAAGLGRLLRRGLRAAERHPVGRLLGLPSALLGVLTVFFLIALLKLLPAAYAVAPTASLALAAIALLPPVAARLRAGFQRKSVAVVAIVAWLLCWPAPTLLAAASQEVQVAILYQPPHLSLGLGIVRGLFDADGDGFSPILLGGDCDDSNPDIHPEGQEIIGNGIDENCSGLDAEPYIAPVEPPFERPTELPEKLNIVLVQIDALRPDHLGFAGYERPLSPELDRFRETATWFPNAYTPAPSTRFAMASIFTGLDPTLVPQSSRGGNAFTMLPAAETVAERLKAKRGYQTYGLTISYVIHHNKGTGQGFTTWKTPWPVDDWAKIYGKAAPITTDDALGYLEGRPADPNAAPYFLFAHYRCPHDPYIKHPEWDYGDRPIDLYDSSIAYCDKHIGRLIDGLEARPDYERTALVFFSDHGELFGEHGHTSHGNSLYEPDVKSLLLVRIPGATASTVDVPVRLTDLGPTLLDLASAERFPESHGWSLLPLFFSTDEARLEPWKNRALYLYTRLVRGPVKYRASGVVAWPYKAIRDHITGHKHLFHLEDDPDETRNLVDDDPDLTLRLMSLIESLDARPAP